MIFAFAILYGAWRVGWTYDAGGTKRPQGVYFTPKQWPKISPTKIEKPLVRKRFETC